jgi:hypothetical protein
MMSVAFVLAFSLFVFPPTNIEQYTQEENAVDDKEEYLELKEVEINELKAK